MNATVDTLIASADPPPRGVANPIHDDAGAAAAGYSGALVAGVRTYGWVADTLTRALGAEWLSSGWVDYRLRRPLYVGETLRIEVAPQANDWRIECTAGEGAQVRVVLTGSAGVGDAGWRTELTPPAIGPGTELQADLPGYDLVGVPLHQPLRPLGAFVTSSAAQAMVRDDLGLVTERYLAAAAPVPIQPYFLAGRMAPLTRHNFTYGPTIHVRSQIQHVREARADQEITVGAQIVQAYERNEHWYQELDGVVSDAAGALALIRHTSIFRPRGT